MSNQKDHSNLLIGAAVAAGILGTLTSLLLPKKSRQNLVEHAKDIAHHAVETTEMINRNLVIGGVAGGLVGVTTALLLAPKAGSDLLEDIYRPFANMQKKARASSHPKKAASKAKSKDKKASHHAEHHAKPPKAKSHKKASSRKATAGRSAARKVAKTIETAVPEVKEAV